VQRDAHPLPAVFHAQNWPGIPAKTQILRPVRVSKKRFASAGASNSRWIDSQNHRAIQRLLQLDSHFARTCIPAAPIKRESFVSDSGTSPSFVGKNASRTISASSGPNSSRCIPRAESRILLQLQRSYSACLRDEKNQNSKRMLANGRTANIFPARLFHPRLLVNRSNLPSYMLCINEPR